MTWINKEKTRWLNLDKIVFWEYSLASRNVCSILKLYLDGIGAIPIFEGAEADEIRDLLIINKREIL